MNLFSFLFSSSLGRKLIMSLTGIFLITFLVVHCGINALIYMNDGGETFNLAAEFMGHTWYIRAMEIGLFLGLILHVIQGLYLAATNAKRRPQNYAVNGSSANSTWYSRSMGLLGTIILLFLVVHLRHFWVEARFLQSINEENTMFTVMVAVFQNPMAVIIYVLGCLSLSYHLLHGFQSAFQTLGVNHKSYTPIIQTVGTWFSIIIPFLFASMPVTIFLGLIK